MDAQWALHIVTWAAIVVLYLGLAAVLREVRLLREKVGTEVAAGGLSSIRLPGSVTGGQTRVVVAADTGCPLCQVVVGTLSKAYAGALAPPVLLTYEPAEQWSGVSGALDVVRDDAAWSAVSHLTPPVLMLVDGGGLVNRLILPANERDVQSALDSWGVAPEIELEGKTDVA